MTRAMDTKAGLEKMAQHLREHGGAARILIAAPTMAMANDYAREFIQAYDSEIAKQNQAQANIYIQHRDGGTISTQTLDFPNRFLGPQTSMAVIVLTDYLAKILDSLDNIGLGLRLGPQPKLIRVLDGGE